MHRISPYRSGKSSSRPKESGSSRSYSGGSRGRSPPPSPQSRSRYRRSPTDIRCSRRSPSPRRSSWQWSPGNERKRLFDRRGSPGDRLSDEERDALADGPVGSRGYSCSQKLDQYLSCKKNPSNIFNVRHDADYYNRDVFLRQSDCGVNSECLRDLSRETSRDSELLRKSSYSSGMQNYRKRTLSRSPSLTYLDEDLCELEHAKRKREMEELDRNFTLDLEQSYERQCLNKGDELRAVPKRSILKKHVDDPSVQSRNLSSSSASIGEHLFLSDHLPLPQHSSIAPFSAEEVNFLKAIAEAEDKESQGNEHDWTSHAGQQPEAFPFEDKFGSSPRQKEYHGPILETEERHKDFVAHQRASKDGSRGERRQSFFDTRDEDKFFCNKYDGAMNSPPVQKLTVSGGKEPENREENSGRISHFIKTNRSEESRLEYEKIHDLFKTVGLDIEMAEISKVAARTQERLYGKKKSASPDHLKPDSRERCHSQSDTRSPESNHKHSLSPSGSFPQSKDNSSILKSEHPRSKTIIRDSPASASELIIPSVSLIPSAPPSVMPSAPPSVMPSARPPVIPSAPPSVIPSAPPPVMPSAPPSIIPSAPPSVIPSAPPPVMLPAPPSIPNFLPPPPVFQYNTSHFLPFSATQPPPNYQFATMPPPGYGIYKSDMAYTNSNWSRYAHQHAFSNPPQSNFSVAEIGFRGQGIPDFKRDGSVLVKIPTATRFSKMPSHAFCQGSKERLADKNNSSSQEEKLLKEKEKWKAEQDARLKKLHYLKIELNRLSKLQGQMLPKKHAEEDPLVDEVIRLREKIAREVAQLEKDADAAKKKKNELKSIAQILGLDIFDEFKKKPLESKESSVKKYLKSKYSSGKKTSESKYSSVRKPSESKYSSVRKASDSKDYSAKKPSESKYSSVRKHSDSKDSSAKKASESRNSLVKKYSESKDSSARKHSENKDYSVKKSSDTKDSSSKKPSESKDSSVKKPSGNKDSSVKKSPESKDSLVRKPSESKDSSVRKPSESKDSSIKKPSESKDSSVEKPSESKGSSEIISPGSEDTVVKKSPESKDSSESNDSSAQNPSESKDSSVENSTENNNTSESKDSFIKNSPENKDSSEGKDSSTQKPSESKGSPVKNSPESEDPSESNDSSAQKPSESKDSTVENSPESKDSSESNDSSAQKCSESKDSSVKNSSESNDSSAQKPLESKDSSVKKSPEGNDSSAQNPSESKDSLIKKSPENNDTLESKNSLLKNYPECEDPSESKDYLVGKSPESKDSSESKDSLVKIHPERKDSSEGKDSLVKNSPESKDPSESKEYTVNKSPERKDPSDSKDSLVNSPEGKDSSESKEYTVDKAAESKDASEENQSENAKEEKNASNTTKFKKTSSNSVWIPEVGQLIMQRMVSKNPKSRRKRRKPKAITKVLNPQTVVVLEKKGQEKIVSIDDCKKWEPPGDKKNLSTAVVHKEELSDKAE